MSVKIVTDSTADLPHKVAQELGIAVVPLYVRFGSEAYRDGVDLSTEEFYRKLASSKTLPSTAAPSPGEIAAVYDKLAEETDEILSIHLSSKYSATYEVALRAREQMKKTCRVEIIDSLSAIMGEGLMVTTAAQEAQAGASLEEIADMVKQALPKTQVRMTFDTLEYLRRGGRIGRAQALLGGLLRVNPIAGIKDGETHPVGRERSRSKAIEWLYNFVAGFAKKPVRGLAVEYATAFEEAEGLVRRLTPLFPQIPIYVSTVSPVVGTHVGPGVLSVSVLER